MNLITNSLRRSERSQRLALMVASILNVASISLFLNISFITGMIYKERIDCVDANVILVALMLTVSVCIVCVVIFQWIINILFHSLFESREKFNINLRLMGGSRKLLYSMYMNEIMHMQIFAVPVGVILIQLTYYILSHYFEDLKSFIDLPVIVVGVIIHLLSVFLCANLMLKKSCNFDIATSLRGSEKSVSMKHINKLHICLFISGITVLILNHTLLDLNKILAKMIDLTAYLLLFDVIIIGINQLILYIGRKYRQRTTIISQINMLGYYNRYKYIILFLMISVAISVGFLSACLTFGRWIFDDCLNKVYFSDSFEYENFVDEESVSNIIDKYNISYSTGVYVFGNVSEEEGYYIQGIDSNHYPKFEKLALYDKTQQEDNRPLLNNKDFDGIILPESSVKLEKYNIGNIFKINIDNQLYNFKIKGVYQCSNNYRWFTCLASKSYLQNLFDKEGKVNMIYLSSLPAGLKTELMNIDGIKVTEHLSRTDWAQASEDKFLNVGVFIMIFPSIIVFICSVVMFISMFVINKKQNTTDVAKLRGFGLSALNVFYIYL